MGFRLSTGLRNAIMGTTGFKGGLDLGRIDIFSGTIPTDADATEGTGVLLLSITLDGGATGLTFDAPVAGTVKKPAAAVWKGTAVATGTASWFRLYDSNIDTGASTTALRLDGTVGTSSADLIMTNVNIVTDAVTGLDNAEFTLPASI